MKAASLFLSCADPIFSCTSSSQIYSSVTEVGTQSFLPPLFMGNEASNSIQELVPKASCPASGDWAPGSAACSAFLMNLQCRYAVSSSRSSKDLVECSSGLLGPTNRLNRQVALDDS